jgi:hypothetical protein
MAASLDHMLAAGCRSWGPWACPLFLLGAAEEGAAIKLMPAAGAGFGGHGRVRASAARHAPRPRRVRAAAVAALGGQPAASGRGRRRVRRRIQRARTGPPAPRCLWTPAHSACPWLRQSAALCSVREACSPGVRVALACGTSTVVWSTGVAGCAGAAVRPTHRCPLLGSQGVLAQCASAARMRRQA